MAFHLKRRRAIGAQLRRIVRKELDAAVAELRVGEPDQDAVHEARKSLKKVRAVLHLLRKPLGRDYQDGNEPLRAAAHALSSLRDADATLDTLRSLHGRFRTVLPGSVVRTVGRGLRGRRRRTRRRTASVVARARGALERSREFLPRRIDRVADFRAVRAGAVQAYRKARDLMAALRPDSGPSRFHAWRKKVKDHWYEVRLFGKLHRGARERAATLARLESLLGDAHDLAMLEQLLAGGSDHLGAARVKSLVLGCIAKSRRSIRKRALAIGQRTFAQSPSQFEETMVGWRKGEQR